MKKNKVLPALERLRENGYIYEQDGATWLRTTDFEDDKDRVLIKRTVATHISYQISLII